MAKKSSSASFEIAGVVHPAGPGGGKTGQERFWTFSVSLQPWRRSDGEIDEGEVIVLEGKLSDRSLDRRMKTIDAYDVLRLRVRPIKKQLPDGRHRVSLVKVLGKGRDKELARRAKALQKPTAVRDKYFGKFTLDRAANSYETKKKWNGKPVELQLWLDECQDEPAFFRLAERLWKGQKKWEKQVRDYAEKELLSQLNSDWLEEDEKPLTAKAFQQRIKLIQIALQPDGAFEFAFDDSDLFGGHVLLVSGTLDDGSEDAEIAG